MDFKYQKAATGLDLSDVSETSSNSEESTTSAQGSKKGTRSSLSPLAEQSMRRLSLVEADHSHAEENKDEDMDMDADHEKDVDRNGAAKMDSDQKHKRPVQAVTKSWSQRGSAPENVDMDDDSDGQTFFATRAAFWTMVAAHGLPSACGPPKGMFEMEEEMGGAWRCRKCMYLDGEVWFVSQLRYCPRCVFPYEPYKWMERVAGEPFGCFRASEAAGVNPAWWQRHWKNS